ncbi:MAG: hypothetical protein ACJ0Q6_07540 [Candidatus Azotimanducaceae bacterium]|uniref:Uncharacterized protein n=1 Tax=OM182 bacterium TaxID=2510334 RepID=A0A520S2M3_9GAMM|nr:hypothetical protein [Gammaproteobacteria bacterium]OUV68635.1 MAG: hypothetical protein CBC93_01005 [Gammaproteobacteria bacterium TMED133]RZO76727.1 MAG: hypothetical protein EVA68_03300 [OM182 bacterium]
MSVFPLGSFRLQYILASLAPALIVSFFVTLFTINLVHSVTREEILRSANALANQVAIISAEHLVNNDALSLNIMLRRLCLETDFEIAMIFDEGRNVIARAGESKDSHLTFIRDITFQNSMIGKLEVGLNLNTSFSFELVTKMILLFLISSICMGVAIWSGSVAKFTRLRNFDGPNQQIEEAKEEICYLVLKLEPFALTHTYSEALSNLCKTHSGEKRILGKNLIISFRSGNHVENGILFALHIRAISELLPEKSSFEGGLDVGKDAETTRKQATYLAGISQGQFIISHRVQNYTKAFENQSFELKAIHHNLMEENQVFVAEEVGTLIKEQALEILSL